MISSLRELLAAGEKLINEHASAAVLRDHLAFVNAQLKVAINENENLENRVRDLEELTANLTSEIKAKAVGSEFEEECGVLFKRHPRGGYHKVPYCPRCKSSLGSIHESIPYSCTQTCGFVSNVFKDELPAIIAALPQ